MSFTFIKAMGGQIGLSIHEDSMLDTAKEIIKKADGNEARYYLVPDTILSVKDGQKISAGDVLARLPKETSKTKDITGGLPRVAELFEARKPKDHAIIAEVSGKIEFGKDYKMKRKISIVPEDSELPPVEYVISKSKQIAFLIGEADICVVCPKHLKLHLPIGTRLALFPMDETLAKSKGLKWDLDGILLSPKGRISTSNENVEEHIEISIDDGLALAIFPRKILPKIINQWPFKHSGKLTAKPPRDVSLYFEFISLSLIHI